MAGLLDSPYQGLLGGAVNLARGLLNPAGFGMAMAPAAQRTAGQAVGTLMQANQAMPWGGNYPQAIGLDPQMGTMDPSVMVPFATDVAGMATTGSLAGPAVQGGVGMGIRTRGGAMSDPTQTGWAFKDVAYPHRIMEPGDWRRVTYAKETGDYMDVELPIRSLNATQETVNPDFAAPVSKNGEPPFVIKKGGQYFVQDGHHRLVAASERGQQTAKVRLVDLDGTTQTDFPLVDAMKPRIRAYHGSPHDFDRFSMDKIGTGEGAQAYGHGLYFAEEPAVAKGYQKALTRTSGDGARDWAGRNPDIDAEVRQQLNAFADQNGMQRPDDNFVALVLSNAAEGNAPPMLSPNTVQAIKETWKAPPGRMYEVDINASPDEFLDWDKPLSEQSQAVRDAVANVQMGKLRDGMPIAGGGTLRIVSDPDMADKYFLRYKDGSEFRLSAGDLKNLIGGGTEGKSAYQAMTEATGSETAATEALRAAGIKGIRYKDAGSRGTTEGGTSNYVVFDDNIINILKKYGIAGLMAGGAGAAALGGSDPASASTPTYTTGGRF